MQRQHQRMQQSFASLRSQILPADPLAGASTQALPSHQTFLPLSSISPLSTQSQRSDEKPLSPAAVERKFAHTRGHDRLRAVLQGFIVRNIAAQKPVRDLTKQIQVRRLSRCLV